MQDQRSRTLEQTDKLGDEFSRILMRTIDVVAACDDKGQVEGAVV